MPEPWSCSAWFGAGWELRGLAGPDGMRMIPPLSPEPSRVRPCHGFAPLDAGVQKGAPPPPVRALQSTPPPRFRDPRGQKRQPFHAEPRGSKSARLLVPWLVCVAWCALVCIACALLGVHSLVCIAWCALVGANSLVCIACWCALLGARWLVRVGWCTLVGEFIGVHCLVCVGWCELVGVR